LDSFLLLVINSSSCFRTPCCFNLTIFSLLSCLVFFFLITPKEFIKNCYTITKPGGLIYIEVPNQDNDVKDLSDYYRDNIWYMKAHISYFTVDIMKQILKELDINNYSIHGFERYDYENYLNWIQNNKPQAKCTYYTGIPKSEEEKIWIEEREQKLITDCFYLFIKKDE
jgi:SAM-dependent methyltransferase